MGSTEPNIVEWLTLAVASLGTLLTAVIGIWSVRRRDREVFDAHIEWEWTGVGPYPELPFLYVQNRSEHSLSIIELSWRSGKYYTTPERGTAVFHDDPGDLNFPYLVKPGETIKIYLEEEGAKRSFERVRERAERFAFFRGSLLWLGLKTIRGSYRLIPGEKALPWSSRPTWMTGEKKDD